MLGARIQEGLAGNVSTIFLATQVADRFYPSSKTCAGYKLETLPQAVREWTCPQCGRIRDRDVSAAVTFNDGTYGEVCIADRLFWCFLWPPPLRTRIQKSKMNA
ncbi:Putative transposase, fragment [gamma proteobacterium HdN1]|nr:Putative transposase, fragment [gamma proteobacterium HdN1]